MILLLALILCLGAASGAASGEPAKIIGVDVYPGNACVEVVLSLDRPAHFDTKVTGRFLSLEFPGAVSGVRYSPYIVGKSPVDRVTIIPATAGKPLQAQITLSCQAKWTTTVEDEGKRISIRLQPSESGDVQPQASTAHTGIVTSISKGATPAVTPNAVSKTTPASPKTASKPDTVAPKPVVKTEAVPSKPIVKGNANPPKPVASSVKPVTAAATSKPVAQQSTPQPQVEGALECSFKDTDLQDIIQVIARIAGVNIIADSSVQGKVTLNLSNISWEEGLGTALRSLGYVLRKDGSVYIVSKTPQEKAPTIKVEDGKLYVSAVGTDIKQLLSLISEKSGMNIVSSPAVDGKISVQLSGVKVEDGVYTFLTANGYTFRKMEDIFVVDKLEAGKSKPVMRSYKEQAAGGKDRVTVDFKDTELTEVLNNLGTQSGKNIVTYGQMQEKVNIRLVDVTLDEALKLVLMGTKYTYKQVDSVYVVGDATNLASPVAQMLTSTKIIPLKYIRAEEAPKFLSGVVPTANIKPLTEQNCLLVVGTDDMIDRVRDEIKLIDKVSPQVMIEAQVVEVSSNATKTLALQLEGQNGQFSGTIPGTGQVIYKSTGALTAALTATVQALVTEGKAKVLANPKITTINGKSADINITQQRYFRTVKLPDNSSDSNAYYYATSQVQSVEAGIMLKIVPFVGASDEITVDISPEVSNVTGTGPDGLPEISRRKANTTVRVRNGETIVIGGLKQREESKSTTRTPILSEIPLVGELFKSRTTNRVEADLMILITPTLLYSGDDRPIESMDTGKSEVKPSAEVSDGSTEQPK